MIRILYSSNESERKCLIRLIVKLRKNENVSNYTDGLSYIIWLIIIYHQLITITRKGKSLKTSDKKKTQKR